MKRYQASCDCGWTRTYPYRSHADRALADHDCRTIHKRSCRTCGWTGQARTAKIANRAKRQHSCARQLARIAARARGEQRQAAIDRTPKPCLHKQARHVHGTYACYVLDMCRCNRCAAANRTYESNRTRQQAYGRWNNYVDAAPARAHIQALTAQGMGLKRIVAVSDVSDVSQGALWKLMYGKTKADGIRTPSRRITASLEQRILAVELDLADGAFVPSLGAARRIQALVALGWSMSKIADRLGILRANFTPLAHGRRAITVATDRAIRALYEELSMTPPPQGEWRDKIAASRARNYAKTIGWLPPLAWDDEDLDNPATHAIRDSNPEPVDLDQELDEAAIERRIHGDKTVRLTTAEKDEVVVRLHTAGVSLAEIERRTGINVQRHHPNPLGATA